uniref:Uncharacterized protein n=1 Tax=Oryza glumipatula TaxID=40148 RepID=A0A0E0AZW6_9ORYZ
MLEAIGVGIGGFVFGNERSESKEDSYVERFLDCISNGTIPDDSRSAMTELQPLVAESHSAQMSFGAMVTGRPVVDLPRWKDSIALAS